MKTVVFDMDGVLFDTEKLCMDSWVAIATNHGMTGVEEVFPLCIGLNDTDTRALIMNRMGEEFPYDEFKKDASAWFHAYVNKNGLPIKKGVREILEYLKENGWSVGLASSSSKKSVLSHLENTGLKEYFSVIVTGDMIEHSKPQPDIYLKACEELGANPKDAFAIEDSLNGIRAAHWAGMKPIMVPDMIAPNDEIKSITTWIFEDLTKVQEFFTQHQ